MGFDINQKYKKKKKLNRFSSDLMDLIHKI